MRGTRVGLIGAWLTAVTFSLARDSHFGVNDALVTFLVTIGLVLCVRIARGGSRAEYAAAGLLTGLAFATKYHGLALLAPLVLAHALRPAPWTRASAVDLLLSFATCALAAILAFPSLVTETARVVGDIYVHLYVPARGGYDGLDPAGGYVYYARTLALGLGWPLLLLAVGGGILGTRSGRVALSAHAVLVALPLVMIAVLGSQQLYFARFLLPALPAILVVAAIALDEVMARRNMLGLVLALLAAATTLVDTLRFDVLLTRTDTRTQARDWVAQSVPRGATIAVDSAPLGPSLAPQDHQVLVANEWSLFDLTAAEYPSRGIEYVVTSTFTSDVHLIDRQREERRQAFYTELPQHAHMVVQFRPYGGDARPAFVYDDVYAPWTSLDRLTQPGPTVTVWQFSAAGDTPP